MPFIPPLDPLVAHAGGAIEGLTYTNSLEAINNSISHDFQLIELDFHWTSDGYPVCLHDWNRTAKKLFMEKISNPLTRDEFISKPTLHNLTLLDFNRLAMWLRKHPTTFIIADAKSDPLKLFTYIRKNTPQLISQFIPQFRHFEHYYSLDVLGYPFMILGLYGRFTPQKEILKFTANHKLFAVSMPLLRGLTSLPGELHFQGIPTYVHTINSLTLYHLLRRNNVFGIYTDRMK